MPIPNVASLYQKIGRGAEGGHEFARFVSLLLSRYFNRQGRGFIAESDASGDMNKLDAYIEGRHPYPELITGFQFKFFPANPNKNQKKAIQASIDAARTANPLMTEFILVTPENFTKEGQTWWEGLRRKHRTMLPAKEGPIESMIFQLTHWGHGKIIELALSDGIIGQQFWPELFPAGIGTLQLAHATIDCLQSNWTPNDADPYAFFQHFGSHGSGRISDPLFDFQFTNSTDDIVLMKTIDIQIEKISHIISGLSAEHVLLSIGTIEHIVDFAKEWNEVHLPDPLIFPARKPLRFNLQLLNFTQDAPGNSIRLKFLFHFSKQILPSESFSLSF
jgi:hypothetical protein